MNLIRNLHYNDRNLFLSMVKDFYSSDAVIHNVDFKNFESTFDAVMDKSPYIRALIIENEGNPIGYALLALTYSNEAGGMVIVIDELYISQMFRGKGFGRRFFEFLEQEYPLAKRFRLEVRKDNKSAIRLYKKLGYINFVYKQMVKDT